HNQCLQLSVGRSFYLRLSLVACVWPLALASKLDTFILSKQTQLELGLFWAKSTRQGALACIVAGSITRLVLFALMPTMFGIDNTLLYIPNDLFTLDFDGFPTLISPIVGLIAFVVVSKMTYKPIDAEQQRAKLEEKLHAL
ncbi:MAG: hypothetical protein AAF243_14350, partial [Cyanobacteria bacterium P01_A01_bin.137]